MSDGNILGFEARFRNAHFFFGTRHMGKDDLTQFFPHYRFCFLKQVHGVDVVDANPETILQADAHYTTKKNHALVIQTADCLPILLAEEHYAVAIHAGWRGVSQNIVAACKPFLKTAGRTFTAAVGPHIQKQSFEVGLDVVEQFRTFKPSKPFVFDHHNPEKRLIDLNIIAEQQLRDLCGRDAKIDFFTHDTVADTLFHSFRRGKQTPDRQYSFVVIADHSS